MIRILIILFVTGTITLPHAALSKGIYLIDAQPVLLYKIVNWWYTCLETNAQLVCGAPLTFKSQGKIKVAYDNQTRQLDLLLPQGVLTQLALFKPASFSGNPGSLKLLWQNPKFFPKDKGIAISPWLNSLDQLSAARIPRTEADRIKGIEPYLTLQIQGTIQGLINHKIALHPIPDQTDISRHGVIRSCSRAAGSQPFPITLSLIHTRSLEVLARYEMVWE